MRAKYKFKCHFHTYLQKQYLFIEKYYIISRFSVIEKIKRKQVKYIAEKYALYPLPLIKCLKNNN
ncbi:hypothetical protein A3860_16380 [Niastella vici]|uniref:Uncharacterized protein n=1 Tax=Niastella vici TaxID=1703345 RepID=A0A1V9G464_9BACT|nr:hypothetical protein A3860_16380 [Niastella vici]